VLSAGKDAAVHSDFAEPGRHHPGDDALELYSLGTLSESETGPIEEHLLVCEACQLKLQETDEYVRAVRTAAAKLRDERSARRWPSVVQWVQPLRTWKPAWAVVLLLIVLPAIWFVVSRTDATPPVAILLHSSRGVGDTVAHAPHGKRLTLSMEAAEVPGLPTYAVEVVGSGGNRVWKGSGAGRDGLVVGGPVPSLTPGRYWVRLYEPGSPGELIREFGLEVR